MTKSTRKARKPSRRTGLDVQESLDYLDQGISVFDGDLELALFNRRLLDLLDLPAGLVEIGVAFEDLIRFNAERGEYGEGDVEALVRQRLELAAEPEHHCFERTRPDGTVLEVRRKPLPGGGFITTYSDVTELKRGEQALRENEDRFRRLYEMAPLGYQSLDIDGNFLEVNQAWLDMFGYAREEVIGRWFGDFVAEKDLFDTNFPRFKEAGEIRVPGYEMRCRDGSAKTVAFDGRVGYDEQGNFLQTHCILSDITERKRAEEELLAAKNKASVAEERLNEAARIANLGYWIWDEVKNKLIDCSEEYARIYGYTKEQMLAQTFNEQADLQFAHPDDRDPLAKTYSEFHVNPETYDVEYRAILPDGTVRNIREIGNPILDEQGRLVQSFGINQDITELKSMERQLAHAQKMEALGQLTGGVAHDFNNILQVILGNLHLVSDSLDADDEAVEPIGHAISAGERGALLTQQLLSFSRRQMLNPEVVDANDVVLGIIQLLHRTLGEDTVIKTRFARDLWPVSIDPGKLENAILNLALNARDAMPEGGELSVETRNELLKQAIPREDGDLAAGRYAVLRISDTGRGMTPEVLEQAFEPFFTTKDVGEGSGLGLSMVYGFARQSGGHLAIASEPGHGTTVTMYLPVAEGRPAAKTANGGGKAVAGGTVLVVEDDAEVRDITAKTLKALGCKVVEAENARSALRALENRDDIELVFTDVVMPGGMDGIGLAEEVERLHPAIKVLLTSGYPTSDFDADDTLEDRFQLLRKPYNTLELAAAVKAVLED